MILSPIKSCSESNFEQERFNIFQISKKKSQQFIEGMFGLSETNLVAIGDQSPNCSSKMKLIDKQHGRQRNRPK
jgi:hypothetical protein